MKKLAIMFLSVAFTGGVALACPHEEAANETTVKTAEKDKAAADKAKAEKAAAEKAKAEEAAKAKTAKPAEKKPADKVSQK